MRSYSILRRSVASPAFAVVLLTVLTAAAAPSQGAIVVLMSGHTFVGPNDTLDGTINYVVLQKGSGDTWESELGTAMTDAFVPGLGSATSLDNTNDFLYVYQVANNGAQTGAVTSFNNSLGMLATSGPGIPSGIGSWGYLTAYGLVYDGTAVSATHDMGTNTALVSAPVTGSLVNPYSFGGASLTQVGPGGFDVGGFGGLFSGILVGQTSSIVGFTAVIAPDVFSGSIQGANGLSGYGPSPAPAPEPGTIALLVVGGMSLAGVGLRRRARR